MSEEDKKSLLLEPVKKGPEALILPVALAAGGVALFFSANRGKKEKKKSSKPKASSHEVVFTKNYGSYSIGKDYERLVLEPYLAEQAEEGNLVLADFDNKFDPINQVHKALMKSTRKDAISAFTSTHKVIVGEDQVFISSLPQDRAKVQEFYSWIENKVIEFQESY